MRCYAKFTRVWLDAKAGSRETSETAHTYKAIQMEQHIKNDELRVNGNEADEVLWRASLNTVKVLKL